MNIKRSSFHVTAPSLCKAFQAFSICPGVPEILDAIDPIDGVSKITRFKVKVFARSENCAVLCKLGEEKSCESCFTTFQAQKGKADVRSVKKSTPVEDKAPLANRSIDRLVATIKQQRLRCKDLERQLVGIKREIYSNP